MKKGINASSASFEGLISNNCLYVDKTKYLYNIITSKNTYFFLSHPRRFGKTLTVSTFENIFKGKKELFKDLYIGSTDYDFKAYPVIHIDFGNSYTETKEDMKNFINSVIDKVEKIYHLEHTVNTSYTIRLQNLIQELSKKGKVVVLVDEYDKPISSSITQRDGDPEGIRDVLRGFFEVLKASYDYVRFVFITGGTKYAKTSIFSAMNNLVDLSFDKDCSTMLGYTQKELEYNFSDYIKDGAKATKLSRNAYLKKLKEKYDGYCFYPGTETVYNPVSISSFFRNGGEAFRNYWSETGGTKLLADIAKRVEFNIDEDLNEPLQVSNLMSYDIVEMLQTEISKDTYRALLFQSGYLTIKGGTEDVVYLDYPNKEVEEYYAELLVNKVYSEKAGAFSPKVLLYYLEQKDFDKFIKDLKVIYASIPYHECAKNSNESYYHTVFHTIFMALGAAILSELPTNKGRLDSVIELSKDIYIFEFKVDKTSEEAISQIRENSYYEQYLTKKKPIHLVGISFSSTERNIVDYKEEIITR